MQGNKLFIGNLDPSVTIEELEEEFSYFGVVKYVKIIKGKRIGFVKMLRAADAEKAVIGVNGIELKGRVIRVEMAHHRERKF